MSVCLLIVLSLQLSFGLDSSSQWTWLSGSSSFNTPGSYGTLGVPSPTNSPGARTGPNLWVIPYNGSFSLFMHGGKGFYWSSGSKQRMSDMWRFDLDSNMWTWIDGPSIWNSYYKYPAVKGVFDSTNFPRAREVPCSFTYKNELYFFGGWSDAEAEGDMWKYNVSLRQWAWVSGIGANGPGSYGNITIPDPSNAPAARSEPLCWSPIGDTFYMFGGWSLGSNSVAGQYFLQNDLWSYNFTSSMWTWLHGNSLYKDYWVSAEVITGLNVFDPANLPQGRSAALTWARDSRYLYLGFGNVDMTIWKFDLTILQWACVYRGGTWQVYRTAQDTFNILATPGFRKSPTGFVTPSGNFLLFGGDGNDESWNKGKFSDVWEYDPDQNLFKWVVGSTFVEFAGSFDTYQQPSPLNNPPGIGWLSSASHRDLQDRYFIFGGSQGRGASNSLWSLTGCPVYTGPNGDYDCNGCFLGEFFNKTGGTCQSCPSGRFITELRSSTFSSCQACPAGRSSLPGSTDCFECSSGKYAPVASSQCYSCPEGRFSSESLQGSCQVCDAGLFAQVGSTSCQKCPKGTYNSHPESGSCLECPGFSTTLVDGSVGSDRCVCQDGYWGDAFRGETCAECPQISGLSCPVNSTVPKVAPGYFRDRADPTKIYSCVPTYACKDTEYGATVCAEGYTGDYCGSCVQNKYFRQSLECQKCPSKVGLAFTILVALSAISFIVYRLIRSNFKLPLDLRIALYWCQVIALFPNLSSSWPDSLKTLFHITSFANLNLDLPAQ